MSASDDDGTSARSPRGGYDAAGRPISGTGPELRATPPEGAPAIVDAPRARELRAASLSWPSVVLDAGQLADLELMLLGAFGPAPSYVGRIRPPDSPPTPTLSVPPEAAADLRAGMDVALRDREGVMIAALRLLALEPAPADGPEPADAPAPPGSPLPATKIRLLGTVQGLELPSHPDYPALRLTPARLRAEFADRGWTGSGAPWAVWADGLLHTADVGRIRALTRRGKHCVVLAPVGGADPADASHHLRIRCLLAALRAVDLPPRPAEVTLAHEPYASEAVARDGARGWPISARFDRASPPPDRWTPDHPPADPSAPDHWAPNHWAAERSASNGSTSGRPEPGRPRSMLVLVPVAPASQLAAPREPAMSATSPGGLADEPAAGGSALDEMAELMALRAHLAEVYGCGGSLTGPAIGAPALEELTSLLDVGAPLPAELTPPAVAAELVRAVPPRSRRGLTVLFTGLAGAGKSTLAGLLVCRLLERGRRVTLLDDDVVRAHLSQGLGCSRADWETTVRRVGFVAAEVAAAGGTAVCAPIAPFAQIRAEARVMSTSRGAGFVLVHVATPREVCEARDRKGLYARARAGLIPAFPGVSEPYEEPTDADVVVDTADLSANEAVDQVLAHLVDAGWVEATPQ